MIRRTRSSALFALLLLAATLALALLAILQYHWVDQISAGERERRQANLSTGARRISEDFNRELARAYLTFQLDAPSLRDRSWDGFARRYERWQMSAPYPRLVKGLHIVEVSQIGRVQLLTYRPELGSFEPEDWSYELLPLRRTFERAYRKIFASRSAQPISIPPVQADSAALLVPVSRPGLLSVQQDLGIDADLLFSDMLFPGAYQRCSRCPPELYDTPMLAHTIVALDQEYIAGAMLPGLAERYFPSGAGLNYHFAVVDRDSPPNLLFSSDARLGLDGLAQVDARVGLFEISYDDLNALLLTSDPRDEQSPAASRVAIGVLGRPGEAGGENIEENGQWQLLLKHRAGSLDAAVGELRARNMLISFGTLLLLAGSVAMLLLSTRRAQRLAHQQIEFASAVSHELRTPLAVICSAGENLADGLVHDPQKARQYGLVISNEGRRLAEMVEQVLAFAGAQSGRQRHARQPIDAAALVQSTLAAMQHQIRQGGHSVELTLPADLPPIDGDLGALRRALQNLISNAIKYGGEDGWIGVEVAAAPAERGGELRISVSDHGPGVEPADLPHIFEPFYRGRRATAAQAHGSGLGLSLVRESLTAHGGRVSVESAPGQGSRFTMHLPLAGDAPLAAPRPAPTMQP